MQETITSLIVGAIQGVSEFLPISSSGHLVIIHNLLSWEESNRLAFDIALHFGTAIAIIVYFWRDWIDIISKGLHSSSHGNEARLVRRETSDVTEQRNGLRNRPTAYDFPNNLLWQIVIASIPAAIVGVFLNDYAETKLGSPVIVAINLILFGVVLWYIDQRSKADFKPGNLSYKQSILIGLSQAVALVPGVSRSGITITAARAQGMDRESAARFSFLLSTPAILGAFLLNFRHIKDISTGAPFWVGVLSSTVFGFLAIKYLLQYLKKSDFAVFLWYRIIVAIAVLAIYFVR